MLKNKVCMTFSPVSTITVSIRMEYYLFPPRESRRRRRVWWTGGRRRRVGRPCSTVLVSNVTVTTTIFFFPEKSSRVPLKDRIFSFHAYQNQNYCPLKKTKIIDSNF